MARTKWKYLVQAQLEDGSVRDMGWPVASSAEGYAAMKAYGRTGCHYRVVAVTSGPNWHRVNETRTVTLEPVDDAESEASDDL